MGTDHCIIVASGFRIPIKVWNEIRKQEHTRVKDEVKRFWKKRKTEPDWDPVEEEEFDMSGEDSCVLDVESGFEKVRYPESGASYAIVSQENTGDDGYVLIYEPTSCESLMFRKIGGAMAWMCSGFSHMQGINTLNFSIKLEDDDTIKDWKLEDGCWESDTQKRKDFLNGLPDPLKKYLEQFPMEKYYNRWVFSFAS